MTMTTENPMDRVCLVWSWRLPATSSSVKVARDHVGAQATRFGIDPDDARLVADELAANAVQHADGANDFLVTVRCQSSRFVVELTDSAPHLLPKFNEPRLDAEVTRGRGLAIVAQLADEVEVHVNSVCKAVCAVFHAPSSPSSSVPSVLEPLAPIDVQPSELNGYAYRMGLPPAYPAASNDPFTVHLTEAHAMGVIPALSRLRPVGDRIATLLAEGASLARRLDEHDAANLTRAFVRQMGVGSV